MQKNSLFVEKISLLVRVGNYAKSRCGAAGSRYEIGSWSPEIAKFPVKFPVSREFAWRPVRSALRRQPKIIRAKQSPSLKLPSISTAYDELLSDRNFRLFSNASETLPAAPRDMDATWFFQTASESSMSKPCRLRHVITRRRHQPCNRSSRGDLLQLLIAGLFGATASRRPLTDYPLRTAETN